MLAKLYDANPDKALRIHNLGVSPRFRPVGSGRNVIGTIEPARGADFQRD